jgi:uncharacterized delta-60 repeat protein
VPFDPALVPAGAQPVLYKTDATQSAWVAVPGASTNGSTMSGEVTSFSLFTVASTLPPLTRKPPLLEFEFANLFDGLPEAVTPEETRTGGLEATTTFGPSAIDHAVIRFQDSLPPDRQAHGYLFAKNNGVTYGVFAESPSAPLGTAQPIGSATRLKLSQSFVKNAADAKLKFTLVSVLIQTVDLNPKVGRNDSFIKGEVLLSVGAYKSPADYFFYTAGRAWLVGEADTWFPVAENESFSRSHLWNRDDFDFSVGNFVFEPSSGGVCPPGRFAQLDLKEPRTYTIDLSSIEVGEEFTLRAVARAETMNRKGAGIEAADDCIVSYAGAYLRDPQEIEGTTIEFSGLTETGNPLLPPPEQTLQSPAACVPGPGPRADAGVLQFAAASFTVEEAAGGVPAVMVTRSGGSKGAVTATLRTADGSAKAGIDYTAVVATVFFGDDESGQRIVTVPIIANQFDEPERTLQLSLSEPGNCAAIGPQASATLVIRDDDRPPTAPPAGALDEVFSAGGKATLAAFGGDESGMVLQPDGKIVMVGGTFAGFVMARFNADGSLDTGFGIDGKVTTDIADGQFPRSQARAVAIQADGKIVVAGEAQPTSAGLAVALARYNADGSLDTSFGSGGMVLDAAIQGRAFAVAIQNDGKIVIAGESPIALGSDFADFLIARYTSDGTLDFGFGLAGLVVTDFGVGASEGARRLVLQGDGKIVASGDPIGAVAGVNRTAVARYDATGKLDPSFGSGGKVLLAAGPLLGRGLTLQSDGKLLLAGRVVNGSNINEFALTRLRSDGSTDTSFGNAGLVTTSITGLGDQALAVALQGDGRILAAGIGNAINNNFALARYAADGSVDTSFASGGKLIVDFFGFSDIAENLVVQPDGKIVVGGLARNNVDGYGLARINP